MIESIKIIVEFITRLLPWGIVIWVVFILHKYLTIRLEALILPFVRHVRILLIDKDKKIIGPNEDYRMLFSGKSIKYFWWDWEFPGVPITIKKDRVVEIMVIKDNLIVAHKKINSGMEIVKIEVDED